MLKKYLSVVQRIIFVISWIFIIWFLVANFKTIYSFFKVQNYLFLIISFLLLFPGFYFQYLIRKLLSDCLNLNVSVKEQFFILAHNGILKYLPGGIWNQLDAVLMLEKKAKTTYKRPGKLVFLEMYWRVVWGIVFFAPIMFTPIKIQLGSFVLVFNQIFYLIFILLVLLSTIFLSKKHPSIYTYKIRNFFLHGLYNLGYWLISGFSFIFLLAAFDTQIMSLGKLYYLQSANALSWIAGFLFIPAPSGLGVREYLLGLFLEKLSLTVIMGFSISLLQRVLILLRDIIVFLIAKKTLND